MRPKVNLAWYLVDYKTNVSVFESQDIKSSAEKDTRLRKLRDVMLITLERILDQVVIYCDFMYLYLRSVDELLGKFCTAPYHARTSRQHISNTRRTTSSFIFHEARTSIHILFSHLLTNSRFQIVAKINAQDVVDGIHYKIESLKTLWKDLPLEKQVEHAKVIISVKKVPLFC